MTTHIKYAGSWREAEGIYIKHNGAWRTCTNVYVRSSGVWREVFTSMALPTSVTVNNIVNNASDYNPASNVSGVATAVPTPSDDGSYNYAWTWVSGHTLSVTGSGASRTFDDYLSDGDSRYSVYKCTVSNARGSVSYNFSITLSYTDLGS